MRAVARVMLALATIPVGLLLWVTFVEDIGLFLINNFAVAKQHEGLIMDIIESGVRGLMVMALGFILWGIVWYLRRERVVGR